MRNYACDTLRALVADESEFLFFLLRVCCYFQKYETCVYVPKISTLYESDNAIKRGETHELTTGLNLFRHHRRHHMRD